MSDRVSPLRRAVVKFEATAGRRGLHAVLDRIDVTEPANYRPIYTNTIEWKMFVADAEQQMWRDLLDLVVDTQLRLLGERLSMAPRVRDTRRELAETWKPGHP